MSVVPLGFAVLIATAPKGTLRPMIVLVPLGLFILYTGATAFRSSVVVDGDLIRWTGFLGSRTAHRSEVAGFNIQPVRSRGGPQVTVRMYLVNRQMVRLPLYWPASSGGNNWARQAWVVLEGWRTG